MTKYKADLKKDVYLTIACVILIIVGILLSSKPSKTSWIFVILFLSVIILANVFSKRLIEIQLDGLNKSLSFIYRNYLKITKIKDYDLQRIEFTYKRQATSLRSGVKNVCTIYYADKRVAQLSPGNDGWTNDEIKSFVNTLIELRIKKKFIGYNLKDVEI